MKKSHSRRMSEGKKPYFCKDGPWKGHKLYLTNGVTAIFTVNGQTGRYRFGVWNATNS